MNPEAASDSQNLNHLSSDLLRIIHVITGSREQYSSYSTIGQLFVRKLYSVCGQVTALVVFPRALDTRGEARVVSKTRVERRAIGGLLEGGGRSVTSERKAAAVSVSGIGSDNAPSRDNAIFGDREDRMLTARSGPLGLGVPRTLGPAEGSDHLFLLPERALIMDSTHLRQDLAGLDFNLHLNLLHTAPRGNVWLCESPLCTTGHCLMMEWWSTPATMRFFSRENQRGEERFRFDGIYLVFS